MMCRPYQEDTASYCTYSATLCAGIVQMVYNNVYMKTHTTPKTHRTNVVIPADLVAEVDRLVGPRRRSAFLSQAAAEKVHQLKLVAAAHAAAGALAAVDIPGWETPDAASAWVRGLRAADEERVKQLWGEA